MKTATVVRRSASRTTVPIPEPALLDPASAPDCSYRGSTGNPATTQEMRAKLDYEAQCYRQAEAIVRGRLGQLQDAAEKMIRAIRQRNLVISSR
jgi:hypothetical protein